MLQSQPVGQVDLCWQTQQDGEMPDECLWILQRCFPAESAATGKICSCRLPSGKSPEHTGTTF